MFCCHLGIVPEIILVVLKPRGKRSLRSLSSGSLNLRRGSLREGAWCFGKWRKMGLLSDSRAEPVPCVPSTAQLALRLEDATSPPVRLIRAALHRRVRAVVE